ncbi:lantibiotic dehydratase [Phytohabitans flavus]|uniref:lantibiotic dehydratase n=1 Tax=Phytohabitans flavus TaxID=1076124 RepID=UPI003633217C
MLGRAGPAGAAADQPAGSGLERHRRVFFERWALAAVAAAFSADPRIRPWLPVGLAPQLTLDDRAVRHPYLGAIPLSAPEAAVIGHCDGIRSAREVTRLVLADAPPGIRQPADVAAVIDHLVQRELLTWGADLPMDLTAEAALRRLLEGVGDPGAREPALAALDRLCARRDDIAAAGDPAALAAAMTALDAEFTEISGLPPRHNAGQTQAGRTLCHLETVRDLDLTIGDAVLAKLAPLEPLLLSARWLTSELAGRYTDRLEELYQDVAADLGVAEVPFERVWYPAVDAFVGRDRPAEPVIEEFRRRWTEVLDLDSVPDTTSQVDLPRAELTDRITAAFPATAPGWAAARIHSPDLHISASSKEAAERGDVTIVLGELHIGLAAFDTHFFSVGHPDPDGMIAAMGRDVPSSRVALAAPDSWPRLTAREAEWLTGPDDVQLGFAPAPGVDRRRLLPVTALTVVPGQGGLRARDRDGRSWPLIEMFTGLLWLHAFDAWKLASLGPHTPRISVDGLVIARETWRSTVGQTGLAGATGERERYLAVRRWRRELGLPERVFVRVDTEVKPCYFDLTSPLYARVLCAMMTAAQKTGGPETGLAVTELLPDSDHAWLTDADGRRYTSELRVQMRDPISARAGS